MLNHRATLAQWAPQLCNEAAQLLWIVFAIAVLQTEERLQHAALAILAHTRILWALQTATCARWPNTRAWKLRSMSPLACSVQATPQLCNQRVLSLVNAFVLWGLQETLPMVSRVLLALSAHSRANGGLLSVTHADQGLSLMLFIKDIAIYVRRAHTTQKREVTQARPAKDALRWCQILRTGTCIPRRGPRRSSHAFVMRDTPVLMVGHVWHVFLDNSRA